MHEAEGECVTDLSDGDLRPQLQLVAAVAAADDGHGGGGAAVVGHRVHGVHPGAGLVARRLQGLRDGWMDREFRNHATSDPSYWIPWR